MFERVCTNQKPRKYQIRTGYCLNQQYKGFVTYKCTEKAKNAFVIFQGEHFKQQIILIFT